MPAYKYTAVNAQGKAQTGTVTANSQTEATNQVKAMGLHITSLTEASAADAAKSSSTSGGGFSLSFGKKASKGGAVSTKVITVFTRQLATLIDAGLPLLRSLKTLLKQEKNANLKFAMQQLADAVESGNTFSEALGYHPKVFNKLYINMVKAGELGGVLEVVLKRLAEFMEKAQRIRGKVMAALTYPMVVLVIAVGILAFLMLFIVPKFKQIFADMLGGKELPFLTQFVIGISSLVQYSVWPPSVDPADLILPLPDLPIPFLPIFLVIGVVAYKIYVATPAGTAMMDALVLKTPVLGDLMSKTAIARFTRTLGTLVSSGVPILQALNITKETAGNVIISNAIQKVHDAVKEGESMVTPLEQSGLFPPMVVSMIQVGEETGQLPDMLTKVADVYEEEVDVTVQGLTSIIEPIMIVFLAVVVGTIVIALFMPLITIITDLTAGVG